MNVSMTIAGTSSIGALIGPESSSSKPAQGSFGNVIQNFVSETNAQQLQADQAIQQLASGQTDSIHETMLAMAKADLSFRVFVEVQAKAVEAYQEVMRMPM